MSLSNQLLLFASIFFTTLILTSCNPSPQKLEPSTLFFLIPSDQSGIDFVNQIDDQEEFNILTYRNFYNGGGVAIGDINNDSLPDIYFSSNMGPNQLYLNQGNFTFKNITDQAGVGGTKSWSTGVSMVDLNADGLLDIYVCNSGDVANGNRENELFINQGDLTFTEEAETWALANKGYSTQAAFFDYDLDGDLDCYLLNNSVTDPNRIDLYKATREEVDELGGDKLMRNEGNRFTDVTLEAGIYSSKIGFGLGVSVSDVNGDYLPDIYISNDFWERDYLYLNKGDGTFSEELNERTAVISLNSMGSDIADLNNDGAADIMTTDMLPGDNRRLKTMTQFNPSRLDNRKFRASYHYQLLKNSLQLNNGQAQFQEMAHLAGVSSTDWSWGALFVDVDNNGFKDIFISNGILRDITDLDFVDYINDKSNVQKIVAKTGRADIRDFLPHMPSHAIPNYLFVNQQDLTFENQAEALGLAQESFSNGAAYGDLDNDGDLDLVVNNQNQPAFIYENHTDKKADTHYISLKFQGEEKNGFGIGAVVHVYAGDQFQSYQHFLTRSFQSSVSPGLVIGLGHATQIDSLKVIWPNQRTQVFTNIAANQSLTLRQSEATEQALPQAHSSTPLFTQQDAAQWIQGDISHTENTYDDFNHEPLLPKMLSTESPRLLQGDVNGDGLDDLIMLCATGDVDKLYLQRANGTYTQKVQAIFSQHAGLESVCGELVDVDNDQDLDLIIGTGGNEYQRGQAFFRLRVYDNDGSGNFTDSPDKTPKILGHFSTIEAADYDQDGDMDLFVGARTFPGNYGLIPESFLLENQGEAQWANSQAQFFSDLGMVTDGAWVDMNGDNWEDLVIVGDWMPVHIFLNREGQLESPIVLPQSSGWWTRLKANDLDQDGDMDLVLGNWGLNSRFQASVDRPMHLYTYDFDQNQKSEFIVTHYPPLESQAYPFATKSELITQLPYLKKENLSYITYSQQTYASLFPEELRKQASVGTVTILQSAILWNQDDTLEITPLPLMAQIAPVFGIVTADLDGDRITDIWLGGNFYGLKPEAGRQASSLGVFLKGKGDQTFTYLSPQESGMMIKGEIRDALLLTSPKKRKSLLLALNNDSLMVYTNYLLQ